MYKELFSRLRNLSERMMIQNCSLHESSLLSFVCGMLLTHITQACSMPGHRYQEAEITEITDVASAYKINELADRHETSVRSSLTRF